MKVSCDVIQNELNKLLPKDHKVIKYVEFSPNIEGDEEGMTSLFAIVCIQETNNEIRMYTFDYHPAGCKLRESNNGKRWFAQVGNL